MRQMHKAHVRYKIYYIRVLINALAVKRHLLIGLKHSSVAVSSFRREVTPLPQLRRSLVRASIVDFDLLLHGFHTLQRRR